ncbi:hypothetical protein QAD02_019210 [Eretmocerus hayati]|uniref:Uncharacterized protein n=1 Tax=Eretmocerus hayati TaxID=131215 RepID=A0ACC2PK51_9HYME|nr:hypothetical protein QAD02_019210 [Eretmocerus hayati]
MMHGMSEHPGMGVLPFDGMGIYEQPRPRLVFKMPRVVPDQKSKFENDELFRRLSRESEVKYTGYRDRPMDERQQRFQNGCREGHTEIAFAPTGTNLQLVFGVNSGNYDGDPRECDFSKEHGKVHLKSHLIMNGVCVTWRGWIDLERLDGVGCLEYDEERAAKEDEMLRDQIVSYNRRMQDIDKHRSAHRTAGVPQPTHLTHHGHHAAHHGHYAHLAVPGAGPNTVDPHGLATHHQDDMEVRLRAF